MSKRCEEFGPNTELVLVVFGEDANLIDYDVPDGFTVLIDSDRSVYRSYGLGRGPSAGCTARRWSPDTSRSFEATALRDSNEPPKTHCNWAETSSSTPMAHWHTDIGVKAPTTGPQ